MTYSGRPVGIHSHNITKVQLLKKEWK